MSLQQFLAVGKSFAGSPREKSPFEMRRDIRLPTFENAPRFAPRQVVAVQADWLEAKPPVAAPAEEFSPAPRKPARARKSGLRQRSWLEILTFGLLGKPKFSAELVQSEMNLDNVRVLRNDLADSDLEVVVKKNKKFTLRKTKTPVPDEAPPEPSPALKKPKKREEWSELTARLFEIGKH